MMDFLLHIEQSAFCTWVRQSESLFAFTGVLLMHTIGMGIVVGLNACIDLRILGFAPALRLSPMEKFFPVLWFGFWVNAITGTILLGVDARAKLTNVDFYVKMVFIAAAVVTVRLIRTRVFANPRVDDGPLSSEVKLLAALSLFFWVGAITAGRLLAYIPSFA